MKIRQFRTALGDPRHTVCARPALCRQEALWCRADRAAVGSLAVPLAPALGHPGDLGQVSLPFSLSVQQRSNKYLTGSELTADDKKPLGKFGSVCLSVSLSLTSPPNMSWEEL